MCICIADSLCYKAETKNTIVKQLYSNKDVKKKKTTMGYHLTPVRMAIIKKSTNRRLTKMVE